MKQKVLNHFRTVDPTLFSVTNKNDSTIKMRKSTDYFSDLCEMIINQQLSGKVGETIFKRFTKLFPKQSITPKYLLKLTDDQIKAIGTSWAKVRFLKDLAQRVFSADIVLDTLEELENQEVIRVLTIVKGIGPWTAEMFLMFSLGREDVFSHGDLGLRRAIQKLYGFKKEPTQKQIEKISAKWSPYRTYACRILWRSLDA